MNILGFNISRRAKRNEEIQFFNPTREVGNFARADVLGCFQMIQRRALNGELHCDVDYLLTAQIERFLRENFLQIQMRFFYDGYVMVNTDTMTFDRFKSGNIVDFINGKIRTELSANQVIMYDDTFTATNRTGQQTLQPYLDLLNVVNNADVNLIENYGAMGILAPENSTLTDGYMDDEDKEEMQKQYNSVHGVKMGRWALMISRRALKYTPITLPIEALQLADRRKQAVAGVLQFLNIPKELHPFFENSKYANRKEAEVDLYNGAVAAFLDKCATLASMIYNNRRPAYPTKLLNNTFWYSLDNVDVLQEVKNEQRDVMLKDLDILQRLRDIDPEMYEIYKRKINDTYEK